MEIQMTHDNSRTGNQSRYYLKIGFLFQNNRRGRVKILRSLTLPPNHSLNHKSEVTCVPAGQILRCRQGHGRREALCPPLLAGNPFAKGLIPPCGEEREEGSRDLQPWRDPGTHIRTPAPSCLAAPLIYLPPHSLFPTTCSLFPPSISLSLRPFLLPSLFLFFLSLRMLSRQLPSLALSVSSDSSHGMSAHRPRLAGCQVFLLFILHLSNLCGPRTC